MRGVVLGLLLVAACGEPARHAAEVTIAGHGAPPPPDGPSAPVGPLDATMPADAAATLVVDPAFLKRAATGLFTHADGSPSNEERELEEDLDVGKGALAPDRLFDTLGIDETRPIAAALAHADAAGQARVARLEAVWAKLGKVPSDTMRVDFGELLRAFGAEPASVRIRVRVPVADPSRARRALRHLLDKAGLRERTSATGVDLMMGREGVTIAVTAAPAWLVADVYFAGGASDAPAPEVLASIRALRAEGQHGGEPPALDGHLVRASEEPRKVAEVAFVNGVVQTMAALAKVDPGMRDRVAAAGLFEAHRALELARDDRGNYFRSVTATLDDGRGHASVRLEGSFGSAFDARAKIAAGLPPERGLAFVDARSFLDVSLADGLTFPMPGDGPNGPADERVLTRLTREAGWAGWLVAAPLLPLYLMTLPVRPPPDAFEPRSAALKLARAAIVEPDRPRGELFVGLLRAGSNEAEAACVLTGAVPCATRALRLDRPAVKVGSKFARVIHVNDRFAVIVGDAPANVDAFRAPGLADPFPLQFLVPGDAFTGPEAAILFGHRDGQPLLGGLSIEGDVVSAGASAL